MVQEGYCNHAVKCWSIAYGGAFKDNHSWSS
jgi:hypothetical protein